jgi:hypothetical protein
VQVGDAATTVGFRAVDRLGNTEEAGVLQVLAAGARPAATATAAVVLRDAVALGRTARVAVTVTGDGTTPTGTVTVTGPSGALATATLAGGRAVLGVDTERLGVGTHSLTVRYSGDTASAPSQDAVTLEVAKATSRTRVSASRSVVRVRVEASVAPRGTVRIIVRTVGGKARTRTVTLHGGRARLPLRDLSPGRHRITATYAGSSDVARSRASVVLRTAHHEGNN